MEEYLVHFYTAVSAICAVLLWWFFIFNKARQHKFSLRKLIFTLVFIGAICRITFAVFNPMFYAPDEEAHFNYIKYIATNKSFPVQAKGAIWLGHEYEYYQPPMYYAVSAIVAFPFVEAGFSDGSLLLVMRLLNILFWLLSLFLALKILKAVKIRNYLLITLVVAFFTMIPTFTSNSASVNNDILTILLGHLFLLAGIKLPSWKMVFIAGVILGLAILTKLSAVVFGVYLGSIFLYKLLEGKSTFNTALLQPLIIAFIAFVCWLPWGLRNLELYGDFTATAFGNPENPKSFTEKLEFTYIYSLETFWSVAGRFNNLYYLNWAGKAITLTALGGLLLYMLKFKKRILGVLKYDKREKKYFIWGGVAAFIANYSLVFKFGIDFGQGQGRLLYPMLLPLSLVFGYGMICFNKWLPYLHLLITGILISYNISYITYSLLTIIRIAE